MTLKEKATEYIKGKMKSLLIIWTLCYTFSSLIGNVLFCLGFYAVSTVFQLFNSNISQIHVSWTIFKQY